LAKENKQAFLNHKINKTFESREEYVRIRNSLNRQHQERTLGEIDEIEFQKKVWSMIQRQIKTNLYDGVEEKLEGEEEKHRTSQM